MIARLLCRVFGHRWVRWMPLKAVGILRPHTYCPRCGKVRK